MLVHKVPPPCLELIEYVYLDPFDLIPASLTCSPSSLLDLRVHKHRRG